MLGVGSLLCGCVVSFVFYIHVEPLGRRLWIFENAGGTSTVLVHGEADALMVDTKYRMFSRTLRRGVEEDLAARVRRIVLTHAHDDHAGGLKLYPGAGAVVVHPNTKKRLEAIGAHAAYVEVDRALSMVLDGEEVRVLDVGSGHTDGDVVVYFPGRKLLVAGDLVSNGIEPYIDESYGGSVLTLAATLRALMQVDFERLVPGHGDVMPRAQVQKLSDYLTALESKVREARANGLTEDQAAAQLTFDDFPLNEVLFRSSRRGNIRAMHRALGR